MAQPAVLSGSMFDSPTGGGVQSVGVNFSSRPPLSPHSSSNTQSAPSGPSMTLRIRAGTAKLTVLT